MADFLTQLFVYFHDIFSERFGEKIATLLVLLTFICFVVASFSLIALISG